MKLASIGVGNMGGAVARRLAQDGVEVTVFGLDAGPMDRCLAAGATRAECLEEAVPRRTW
ncbi:NAD(P)-binding domain-containing protein [Citricoccus sp.]|uniref:NAD(P)-binding domain-containing protein n=1 Tax=Citricoccus sp. TaxID=1978372 RepID=UPI0028BE7799|nr:NAD(P)-binding domain-containing protein [Citricoccus sp.]